ncbi:uncharacterized protein LOC110112656 isoform X2 [Dendrobium catenatum]|uniref:Water stress and hypersensitive response domain-containing protein n=1 Tax=Dendrobium catenatum TaxID=906689 RepID=A0A2I0VSP4_9ASPA|nr:uncharacterized protein LOC110112656 isoform X2 [Dendrobium catenatum]PKU66430.1 hypothetical protein MA16_Dca009673 [Dendrobium catenatum]
MTSMASTGETNRRRYTVSYKTAAIGAASAAAAAAAIFAVRPKDPTFQLVSINLSSFHLNLPVLDLELTLAVHVTNPNIVPVRYSPASVSIFYAGSLLGSAALEAGSQPPMSCSLVYLPARLNGLQLAQHAASILADAARRRMSLDAAVDIAGDARLLFWSHRFMLRLESHVLVDPIFLDVIDQDNHSETHLSLSIMQHFEQEETALKKMSKQLKLSSFEDYNDLFPLGSFNIFTLSLLPTKF